MRNFIIIIGLLFNCFVSFGQLSTIVYVKYHTCETFYVTKVQGYKFASYQTRNVIDEFSIRDSIAIKEIEGLFEKILSDTIRSDNYPDVRQEIVISRPDESYDMLFSDGVYAMEINGRAVPFNAELQNIIDFWIRKRLSKISN